MLALVCSIAGTGDSANSGVLEIAYVESGVIVDADLGRGNKFKSFRLVTVFECLIGGIRIERLYSKLLLKILLLYVHEIVKLLSNITLNTPLIFRFETHKSDLIVFP